MFKLLKLWVLIPISKYYKLGKGGFKNITYTDSTILILIDKSLGARNLFVKLTFFVSLISKLIITLTQIKCF
jgi:hypothetical protein